MTERTPHEGSFLKTKVLLALSMFILLVVSSRDARPAPTRPAEKQAAPPREKQALPRPAPSHRN